MNSSKTRRQKLIEELVEKVCRQLEEDFKDKKNLEKGKTSSSESKPSSVKSSTEKREKNIKKPKSYGRRYVVPGDIWGV